MHLSRNWFRLRERRAGYLLGRTDLGSVSRKQPRNRQPNRSRPRTSGGGVQSTALQLAGTHKQLVCLCEAHPKFAKSAYPPYTELQKPAHVALLPPGIILKKRRNKKYSYLMMAVSPWRMVMLSVVRCMSTLRTGNPVGRRQSSLKKEDCSCLQHVLRPTSIFKANESTSR